MPVTPAVWTAPFQANTVDTDLVGRNDQITPAAIGLANGNILVTWVSNSNAGAGAPGGLDVIGQILDPTGQKVGGEIRLNSIYTGDNEQTPSIVAEADGGFTVVYEDQASATDRSVRLERYDASGALTFANTVAGDPATGGTPNFLDPVIAGNLLAPGIRLIAWVADNGGGAQDVMFRMFSPVSNVFGVEKLLFTGAVGTGAGIESLAATHLGNGSFAVAFSDLDSATESDVEVHIISSGGNELAELAVSTGSGRNDAVGIADLGNHTMIVSWQTGAAGARDVVGQIVDEDGNLVGGQFDIAAGAGDQYGASVVNLPYGGFAVAWIEGGTKVFAQTFSDSGAKIGGALLVADVTGGIASVNAAGLGDGRFTVSWTANDGGDHDVFTTVLDARDTENNGTTGNDVIVGTVKGESIQDFQGNDTIYAGAGDDTVYGGPGADRMDGGPGHDKVSYQQSNGAVKLDLLSGAASGGHAQGDLLISFEDATGSAFGDEIKGTGDANLLQGLAGNDTLYGGGGDDTLAGGDGVNDLYGGFGADRMEGFTGISRARYDDASWGNLTISMSDPAQNTGIAAGDTYFNIQGVFTGDGNDSVTGNALDNYIQTAEGNDTLDGAGGVDTLVGGAGNDLYRNVTIEDHLIESANQGIDMVETAEGYSILFQGHLENITLTGSADGNAVGNALDNVLTGNAGKNELIGGVGNDTLIASSGGLDTLYGGDGDDTFVMKTGDFVVESENSGYDTMTSDQSILMAANVEKAVLTGSASTDVVGNAIANLVAGNGGNNKLYGYGAADTLKGGEGNDTLDGGAGADELRGGQGDDTYINPTGDTIIEGANGGTDTVKSNVTFSLDGIANVENLTLAGSAGINGTGNALNNLITGNGGANALDGKDGKDILAGGAGNDTMTGGDGADTFRFGVSGEGTDRITDFDAAADRFDLTGLAFTGVTEANGNTALTYGGGKIVIEGVTGMSLAQWNALVLPAGGAAKAAAAGHDGGAAFTSFGPAHHLIEPAFDLPLVHHADFAFA